MRVSSELLGVVLCGGLSQRMGQDKGLLSGRLIGKENRPWALLMGDKLSGQGLPVVYSIQDRQSDAYSAILPRELLIVDSRQGDGPLDGLYSVHHRFPDRDLLLVACDMPDLDAGTIRRLIDGYAAADRPVEFFAYQEEGKWQPFCAIYTHAGLARALASGGSLQRLLRDGLTYRLSIADPNAFKNYNTL